MDDTTETFPAIDPESTQAWSPEDKPSDLLPDGTELRGRHVALAERSCRCDDCKYGKTPGAGVVLYYGPDVVAMTEAAAIRDGRYEDTETYASDHAPVNVHLPAMATLRKISRNISTGHQRVMAALAADPSARYGPKLAEGLRVTEAELGQRLAAMRAARTRDEPGATA
jgi:hypothetical protein